MQFGSIHHAAVTGLICLSLMPGCASTPVPPAPLDTGTAAREFGDRRMDDPALKAFLERHGRAPALWPIDVWSLDDLALAALHFRAEYRVAEAEVEAAEKQRIRDLQRPNPQLGLKAEHSNDPSGSSPWTVGLELAFSVPNGSQRSARETLADIAVKQTALNLSDSAWQIYAQVRDAVRERASARDVVELRARDEALSSDELQLTEKRVEVGAASSADQRTQTDRRRRAALAIAEANARLAASASALANALGVPVAAIEGLKVADAPSIAAQEPDFTDLQRNALQRRHDLRRALLDYAAAEAAIQREATRERDMTVAPGFKWDQGANVWSLAGALVLPLLHDNRAAVAAAVADRQVAARRVDARQQRVLGDVRAAWDGWRAQRNVATSARAAQSAAQASLESARRQYAGGAIDRLEMTQAEAALIQSTARLQMAEHALAQGIARLEDAAQFTLVGGTMPRVQAVAGPDMEAR